MKAYNCECPCGQADRIVKSDEVIKCSKCNQVMVKVGGPIGGSNIVPLSLGQPDRFIPFESETLGRKINTEIECKAAYDEMYGVQAVEIAKIEKPKKEEETEEKSKRGRPKKVVIEDEDEEEDA